MEYLNSFEELRNFLYFPGVNSDPSVIDSLIALFGSFYKSTTRHLDHDDPHPGNILIQRGAPGSPRILKAVDVGLAVAYEEGMLVSKWGRSELPLLYKEGADIYQVLTSLAAALVCIIDSHYALITSRKRSGNYYLSPELLHKLLSYFTVELGNDAAGRPITFNFYHFIKSNLCLETYRHPFHLFYVWFIKKLLRSGETGGSFDPRNMKAASAPERNALSEALINAIIRMPIFHPHRWAAELNKYAGTVYSPMTTKVHTLTTLGNYMFFTSYARRTVRWITDRAAEMAKAAFGLVAAAGAAFCGPRIIEDSDYVYDTEGIGSVELTVSDDMIKAYSDAGDARKGDRKEELKRKSPRLAGLDAIREAAEIDSLVSSIDQTEAAAEDTLGPAVSPDELAKQTVARIEEARAEARVDKRRQEVRTVRSGDGVKPKPNSIQSLKRALPLKINGVPARVLGNPPKSSIILNAAASKLIMPSGKPRIMPRNIKNRGGGRRTLRKKLKSKQTRKKSRSRSYNSRH